MSIQGFALRSRWVQALYSAVIYGFLALAFTGLGMLLGPASAQVGGTRPADTIPDHIAELAAFGLALGLASMVVYGKQGLPFVFLTPVLTVLLDIDHLPAYLGLAEPVRPAHSAVFIACALAATAITIKAVDIELVMASAFMGHLAVDTGIIAPFSPLSFDYVQLTPYRLPLASAAVVTALAAGVVLRRRPPKAGAAGEGSLA